MSIPENKKITFLSEHNDSKELQISGHISTTYKPKAIYGLRNGDIAVSWSNPLAFGVLGFSRSLYGTCFKELIYFREDVSGRTLKSFDFMAIDEKRTHVIQSCTSDKAVYCFDLQGNPKFKYNHVELTCPRGVSISGNGNIFVCDETKSVIHVISPEGLGLHVIRDGCPEKPLAIAFDDSGLHFAVSQRCDPWKLIRVFRLA